MERKVTATRETLREELRTVAYEVIETLLEKREDYGTDNIAITGRYGLAVRIQDKASRLLNLSTGRVPRFESQTDTYRDLIGYAMIGLVGHLGWGLDDPNQESLTSLVAAGPPADFYPVDFSGKIGGTE